MYFFIAGLLGLVFVLAVLAALVSRQKGLPALVAAGSAALLVIFTVLMSLVTVEPRSVGIQTSFGKYVDTLENGTQLVAPWSQVEEFSTQIQDLKLEVPVSFAGGSSGIVTVTDLWAIDGDEAEQLWKDHKTFEAVRDRIVRPYSETEIAAAFSSYQPEDARDGGNRAAIQNAIKLALSGGKDAEGNEVVGTLAGRGIVIDSIQITNVQLGERAQNSVDRVAEAAANTVRATEEQERAVIEAETARIRQESQTPEAIQRYCLEVLNSWSVANNGPLPATLNCNFGEAGQVPVIVGGQ